MGRKESNQKEKKSTFLIQNIWCGYSEEPSQWDGPLEQSNHMFKLMGKKIIKSLRNIISLSGSMNSSTSVQNMKKPFHDFAVKNQENDVEQLRLVIS